MQRGTFQMMKTVNKSLILNTIRMEEPISRAQIAKETKLTPPTVSTIVKELIDQGIVVESELGESKGGRKPTMLLINSNQFFVIGVDVGPNTIDCILTDLSGKVIKRASNNLVVPISNSQFLSILKYIIGHTIHSIENKDKILGIGVAMHGVVNVETGTSLLAPNLKLTNIPIKDELESEFDLVVKVENDARAMVLGESWFGHHGYLSCIMAVNLGNGVGAGIVINGKLYHGANDLAGEVGHMTIDMNGDICDCGNRGCLQTFATSEAIAKRSQKLTQSSITSGKEVYDLALAGNQEFVNILEETGKAIGIGITNLIHIINPDLVILGGGVTNSEQFLLPSIKQEIKLRGLTEDARQTKVTVSKLGEDATLLGAISLLLEEIYNPTL